VERLHQGLLQFVAGLDLRLIKEAGEAALAQGVA